MPPSGSKTISAFLVLVALVWMAICTPVAAEDSLAIRSKDGLPARTEFGKILAIHESTRKVVLWQNETTTVQFDFDEIERLTSGNKEQRWEKVWLDLQKGPGTDGPGEGAERKGLMDHGAGGNDSNYVLTEQDKREIGRLVKQLGSSLNTEDELVSYGGKATKQVLLSIGKPTDSTRQAVCRVLGKLGDKQAIEPLIARLKSERSEDVRKTVVISLGKLGAEDSRVLEALAEQMKAEECRPVMRELVRIVGPAGNSRPELKKQIVQDTGSVKSGPMVTYFYACQALMGDLDSGKRLQEGLRAKREDDVFFALSMAAVTELRDDAFEYLISQLEQSGSEIAREEELIHALMPMSQQDFGYFKTNDVFERTAAKNKYISWWRIKRENAEGENEDR